MEMKKFAILALLVCLATLFVACQPPVEPMSLDKVNSMAQQNYTSIKVETKTTVGEFVLVDTFVYTLNNNVISVDYKTQRLAEFGESVLNNPIITETGSKTVDGSTLNCSYNFNQNCLADVNLTETSLSATVVDAQAFLGTQVQCSNMTVVANLGTHLQNVVVAYTTTNGTVTTTWTFTK